MESCHYTTLYMFHLLTQMGIIKKVLEEDRYGRGGGGGGGYG